MSKLVAERSFAQAAARSGRWEAIACLPSDNVGPIQSAHQKEMGPWQHQIAMMLQGKCPQNRSYRPWMPVDVRDNAECHIGLLESVQVRSGDRYLAWSAERHNVEAISRRIRHLLPELGLAEAGIDDDHPAEIKAREAELRAIWARSDLRNDRVRAVTRGAVPAVRRVAARLRGVVARRRPGAAATRLTPGGVMPDGASR